VHIQETRGATVIDVDTGNPAAQTAQAAALAANLAAAELIARQIRLGNIGGGIVVDFVGLEGRGLRERVGAALTTALRADPLQPRVLGWTRLGHLELVRPRRGRTLADAMLEPDGGGARRKRPIALAHEALRVLLREARTAPGANWTIRSAPAIAVALSGTANPALRGVEARLGRRVEIIEDAAVSDFDISPR
jgi:ribonuclease G